MKHNFFIGLFVLIMTYGIKKDTLQELTSNTGEAKDSKVRELKQ